MTPHQDWHGILSSRFGFSNFRQGQEQVLQALETNGRALAVFPTGAGKSLCYQLPALTYDGLTLVVSPLIALMKDQIDFLRSRGIEAGRLDSSLTLDEQRDIQDKIRARTLKLLYVSPERFKNERFNDMIAREQISLFAVDEAHCISEWGHNFRPDYLKLAQTARTLKAERILALTATATPDVVRDICAGFEIPTDCAVLTGFYRPNLKLAITPTPADQRDGLLVKRLNARPPGPTIVYVTLQKTAERIAEELGKSGFAADPYHAGMETEQRTAVQERWMASDQGIVVATIAFGMGIDKADVRYVYHYNMPKSIENYSQEIGRAGRDGADSVVEMFANPEDIPTLENFVYGDTPTDEAVRALVQDVLARPTQFDLSLYELSDRHDIRVLVLKTALTYLELLGAIREGAPYYAGYRFCPNSPLESITSTFDADRARLISCIFAQAGKGRKWYSANLDDLATRLSQPRERLVRALEYLHQRGDIQLEASEVRNRFTRLRDAGDADSLAAELIQRFARREALEIKRLSYLVRLAEYDGCLTNALSHYFGHKREEPCGHCARCITGRAGKMPAARVQPALPAGLDLKQLQEVRSQHSRALAHPRQLARFLCGLPSPALSKARLPRNELFGVWQEHRFKDVLEWCAAHARD